MCRISTLYIIKGQTFTYPLYYMYTRLIFFLVFLRNHKRETRDLLVVFILTGLPFTFLFGPLLGTVNKKNFYLSLHSLLIKNNGRQERSITRALLQSENTIMFIGFYFSNSIWQNDQTVISQLTSIGEIYMRNKKEHEQRRLNDCEGTLVRSAREA